MKSIKRLVDRIDEELKDAQMYAEKYVQAKADGKSEWSNKFKSMSEDELKHALTMHDYAVEEINRIKQVYQPSQTMLDKWNASHAEYVDRTAWIKQMLSM